MEEENKLFGKIWRGAFFSFVGLILVKLLGLIYKIVTARTGAYNYGLFTLGIGVIGLVSIFSTFGLDTTVMRYAAQYLEKGDQAKTKGVITSALKITAVLSVIIAFLTFIFARHIATLFFHNPDLAIILQVMAIVIPFDSIRKIIIATTKAFQYVKYEIYIENMLKNGTKVLLTVLIIFLTTSALGLSIAFAVSSILSTLIAIYLLEKKVYRIFRNPAVSKKSYKELLDFSWPLLFADIFYMLLVWTDSMLIGHFMDAKSVGIYNAATPVSLLLYVIPLSLVTIFLPIITSLYQSGKKNEMEHIYSAVTRWTFIINLMTLLGIVIFPAQIISLIFGKEYASASLSLVILAVGYFMHASFLTAHRVLVAYEKTKLNFIDNLICFLMNVVLNIILVPRLGIAGAAIATTASFTILTILYIIQVRQISKMKTFNKHFLIQSVPVLIIALLVFYFRSFFSGYKFIGGLLLIPLFSLLFIYILKLYTSKEVELFQLLRKKIKPKPTQVDEGQSPYR